MLEKIRKDKRGIFGLTAVQQFFVIILGIALLAYVIVVIMGTLSSSTVLPLISDTVVNESKDNAAVSYFLNGSGVQLKQVLTANNPGATNPTIITIINSSGGEVITSPNYTVTSSGLLRNNSARNDNINITYSWQELSNAGIQTQNILGNTSTGITGFFTSINPVYAILAILVIILVLVVLVRVVAGGGGMGGREESPQL